MQGQRSSWTLKGFSAALRNFVIYLAHESTSVGMVSSILKKTKPRTKKQPQTPLPLPWPSPEGAPMLKLCSELWTMLIKEHY